MLAAPLSPCCLYLGVVTLELAHLCEQLVLGEIPMSRLNIHNGDNAMAEQRQRTRHRAEPRIRDEHAPLRAAVHHDKHALKVK